MYVYKDVRSLTKQCASTDLNVHLQRLMYTANKVEILQIWRYTFKDECTFKKFMSLLNAELNIHL